MRLVQYHGRDKIGAISKKAKISKVHLIYPPAPPEFNIETVCVNMKISFFQMDKPLDEENTTLNLGVRGCGANMIR